MTNASHQYTQDQQLMLVKLHQLELSEAWREANGRPHRSERAVRRVSRVRHALAGAAFRVGVVSFRLERALRGPETA